uniref:Delta11-desaturase n=1 Tax=Ostrinia furnacalis TaxID=93504 RepID=A0A0F7R1B9_OSTFU|nr:delta11-desaturase [Ostrinia furnacalis]
MDPYATTADGHPEKDECFEDNEIKSNSLPKLEILHLNVMTFTSLHLSALYGLYLGFTSVKWATIGLGIIFYFFAEIGITAGAHRLWSHRSYKAKLPLEILLIVFNSMAFQNTALSWARDHRVHHKCPDTNGDPHNANRGFFYSHVGWLMTKKSDEVIKQGKLCDVADLYSNPVLRFQKKYAVPFIGTLCFVLPTLIPMYFWGETLNNAWHFNMFRYVVNLNATFCVNSVVHKWGYKPYDKNICPTQNVLLNLAVLGEAFHNYHHVFPWDYRAAELGNQKMNPTTLFIDFFAWIGWAYDLKTASKEMIKSRSERTGDGTDLWGHSADKLK